MSKSVGFRPTEVSKPGGLQGYSGNTASPPVPAGITHATEVVLASFQCPRLGFPVIENLYMDGDATGAGKLHFRITSNGQTLPYWWADTYSAVGQLGLPMDIGENLPPGALIEIRCKNEDGADDTLKAYCAGEIRVYEKPI